MRSLPNPDITPLITVLNYFHPLNQEIIEYLKEHVVQLSCRKGTRLLKSGSVCEYIFFIKEGVIRGFITDDQKDITTWISSENELVTSIYSLDSNIPALENIQVIEESQLLAISNEDLQKLYLTYPEFNIVGRKLIQQYYRDAESRAFIIRLSKAEDKYNHFLRHYSHLSNRISLKYIASFLGITLETLSRVRGRMSMRGSSTVRVIPDQQ